MEFLRKLAAPSPMPAGGAVVAYSACLAIGLYMKIPPSPLYQRGVRGDFHASLCPSPGMGVIQKVVFLEMERKKHTPEIAKNLLVLKREVDRLLDYMEELVEEYQKRYREVMVVLN